MIYPYFASYFYADTSDWGVGNVVVKISQSVETGEGLQELYDRVKEDCIKPNIVVLNFIPLQPYEETEETS